MSNRKPIFENVTFLNEGAVAASIAFLGFCIGVSMIDKIPVNAKSEVKRYGKKLKEINDFEKLSPKIEKINPSEFQKELNLDNDASHAIKYNNTHILVMRDAQNNIISYAIFIKNKDQYVFKVLHNDSFTPSLNFRYYIMALFELELGVVGVGLRSILKTKVDRAKGLTKSEIEYSNPIGNQNDNNIKPLILKILNLFKQYFDGINFDIDHNPNIQQSDDKLYIKMRYDYFSDQWNSMDNAIINFESKLKILLKQNQFNTIQTDDGYNRLQAKNSNKYPNCIVEITDDDESWVYHIYVENE